MAESTADELRRGTGQQATLGEQPKCPSMLYHKCSFPAVLYEVCTRAILDWTSEIGISFNHLGVRLSAFFPSIEGHVADVRLGAIATRIAAIAFDLIIVGYIWHRCRGAMKLLVARDWPHNTLRSSTISTTLAADGM